MYASPPVVTPLRAEGFAALPAPRSVEMRGGTVQLSGCRIVCSGVAENDISARLLRNALEQTGPSGGDAGTTIRLAVEPGSVRTGTGDTRDAQAYRLEIAAQTISITGNALAGLFYGVQTLIQLIECQRSRPLRLPLATIVDWPQFELRTVHWDTKHHQDRPETLRRFLDEMARLKLNAVAFELEDKFEYPSHPVIGAPGAFSTAQLQELVRYGLERHIQIIPNVQAPAHLCYVLKHPEFAHLRCDGSNYQSCMDEPEAVKLIFDMYADLCVATEGVQYFHVSTDEVYYAGICEKFRKPYNPVNRSLTFADYVRKAHAFLRERGRRMIIWAEFPLLGEHLNLLPPDIIDGIIGGDEAFLAEENRLGIRQFSYSSMQGEELLFPNHFAYSDRDGRGHRGRLADAFENTLSGKASRGNPIGAFAAAWDDSGLHNETFWLGWAAMAQCGWTPGATSVEQTVSDFFDVFYGPDASGMVDIYRELQAGARFFEHTWERRPSKVRGPAYGCSKEKRPVTRTDWTLSPPALPVLPTLAIESLFRPQCKALLAELPLRMAANERLLIELHASLSRTARNRANLEALLSIAELQRHHLKMLQDLARAEEALERAASSEKSGDPKQALAALREALSLGQGVVRDLARTFEQVRAVWEKNRFPKNADVAGRKFLHVMDDVKDHFADRRADLTYLIAPEESLGLPQWCASLSEIIGEYARQKGA